VNSPAESIGDRWAGTTAGCVDAGVWAAGADAGHRLPMAIRAHDIQTKFRGANFDENIYLAT
jgi:hypothetical protein